MKSQEKKVKPSGFFVASDSCGKHRCTIMSMADLKASCRGSQLADNGGEQGAGVGHEDVGVWGAVPHQHLPHGVRDDHEQPV